MQELAAFTIRAARPAGLRAPPRQARLRRPRAARLRDGPRRHARPLEQPLGLRPRTAAARAAGLPRLPSMALVRLARASEDLFLNPRRRLPSPRAPRESFYVNVDGDRRSPRGDGGAAASAAAAEPDRVRPRRARGRGRRQPARFVRIDPDPLFELATEHVALIPFLQRAEQQMFEDAGHVCRARGACRRAAPGRVMSPGGRRDTRQDPAPASAVAPVLAIRESIVGRQRDTYLDRDARRRARHRRHARADRLPAGLRSVGSLAARRGSARAPSTRACSHPTRSASTRRCSRPPILARFARHGVQRGQLFFGHGSFNILERVVHKLVQPGCMIGVGPQFAEVPWEAGGRGHRTTRCRWRLPTTRCRSTRCSPPCGARRSRSSTSTTPTTRWGSTTRPRRWSVSRRAVRVRSHDPADRRGAGRLPRGRRVVRPPRGRARQRRSSRVRSRRPSVSPPSASATRSSRRGWPSTTARSTCRSSRGCSRRRSRGRRYATPSSSTAFASEARAAKAEIVEALRRRGAQRAAHPPCGVHPDRALARDVTSRATCVARGVAGPARVELRAHPLGWDDSYCRLRIVATPLVAELCARIRSLRSQP